jgi:hypothetical protein
MSNLLSNTNPNTWTGINTFTQVPKSTAAPDGASDITNKAYVDNLQTLSNLTSLGSSGLTTIINGDLVASNITIYGSTTTFNTFTSENSNLELTYIGPGYALNVYGSANFQSNLYAPTTPSGSSNSLVATTGFVSNAITYASIASSNYVNSQAWPKNAGLDKIYNNTRYDDVMPRLQISDTSRSSNSPYHSQRTPVGTPTKTQSASSPIEKVQKRLRFGTPS